MPTNWSTVERVDDEDEETFTQASIVHYEYGDPYRVHIGDASEVCDESERVELVAVVDFPEEMTYTEACRWEVENAAQFTEHLPDDADIQQSAQAALSHIR